MLDGFREAGRALADMRKSLQNFEDEPGSATLPSIREKWIRDIKKMEGLHAEHGNAFEVLGYEIEEIQSELAVI